MARTDNKGMGRHAPERISKELAGHVMPMNGGNVPRAEHALGGHTRRGGHWGARGTRGIAKGAEGGNEGSDGTQWGSEGGGVGALPGGCGGSEGGCQAT